MSAGSTAVTIVSTIVGSGIVGTVLEALRRGRDARRKADQLKAEQPGRELDSSMSRAQAALTMVQAALDATVKRAEDAEEALEEMRDRMAALEEKFAGIKSQLDAAMDELAIYKRGKA